MHGTVIQSTGTWYGVLLDDGREARCKVKGKFRLQGIRSTNPVAVGDGVQVEMLSEATEPSLAVGESEVPKGYITALDDRRNFIVRRASNLSKQSHILAANLDQVLLLCTVARPETSTTFIDRFLASAQAYRVPVLLCFNKADDVLTEEEREVRAYLIDLYRQVGYVVCETSATTGLGVDSLRPLLAGKTTLLAGHSGVGKSTLLNVLIPGAEARTSCISEAHGTGMHTTTASTLYRIPPSATDGGDVKSGALIDVPGIKGFGTLDMRAEEVGHYFLDIFALSHECRFQNCTHTHEPGCAVRQALEDGRLAPSRFASYLSILDDEEEGKYR